MPAVELHHPQPGAHALVAQTLDSPVLLRAAEKRAETGPANRRNRVVHGCAVPDEVVTDPSAPGHEGRALSVALLLREAATLLILAAKTGRDRARTCDPADFARGASR